MSKKKFKYVVSHIEVNYRSSLNQATEEMLKKYDDYADAVQTAVNNYQHHNPDHRLVSVVPAGAHVASGWYLATWKVKQ